jgi:hypothetical protein
MTCATLFTGRVLSLARRPHSPDLTPCDFWLWGVVKKRVYNRKIRDISDLKDRVWTVVSSVPRGLCVRALNGTVARRLLCVKQDGEQVETVLYIILHISCIFCVQGYY